ncbi:MAG: hypothetical protein M3Z67_05670 [Commensalibacter sp.]|nr:hypothetical protein [Commensalibacter sp.]
MEGKIIDVIERTTSENEKASKVIIDALFKIAENGYNLSVNSYVETEDTREVIDIKKLNAEIKMTVEKIDHLRAEIDSIIAEIEA